jgi:type III secretion protein V
MQLKLGQSLGALPFRELGRRPDIVLAVVVAFIASMLITPLPSPLIDALIAVNMAVSLLVLMVALFAKNALEVSSFPTLLLITTLFRLGLNVSTTRGILARAEAGAMVKAFGKFVIQGDLVVGLVIFLVITLVQFLVVAKGAERVAEVGARFTLDAMPGKQMSIDAAVRSGAITEKEAQLQRDELGRASQLFGNMDGAMKFVKGDTIAGLVIIAINISAGLVIGVLRNRLPPLEALELYSTLTVGDGLVAQVSALLITLAAGVLVTRVEAKDKTKNLGFSLKEELLGNTKALYICSALMGFFALMPGLPALPFVMCALMLSGAASSAKLFPRLSGTYRAAGTAEANSLARQAAFKEKLEQKVQQAKAQKSVTDNLAASVVPIAIDLDPRLSAALGFGAEDGRDDEAELISVYVPQLRDALYLDTGVRFPGVRVRSHVLSLPPETFCIRINDVPVVQERLPLGHCLATANPEQLLRLAIKAKPIKHPISKGTMSLILPEEREVVAAAGITVWNESGLMSLYLAAALRKRSKEFIGLQEVSELIERLEKSYPALVREVVPKVVSLQQLVSILKRLVEENVSIRNLKSIAEALGEFGARDGDALFLTEKVRAALAPQLAHAYAGLDGHLPVLLLEPLIEDTIRGAIERTDSGQVLTLEPELCRTIVSTIHAAIQPAMAKGKKPVVLTGAGIRRFVRKLLEVDLPQVAVLSYDELPSELTVQPLGRACLSS